MIFALFWTISVAAVVAVVMARSFEGAARRIEVTETCDDPYRGVSDNDVSERALGCWCCDHLRARLRYQPPECWPDWYRQEIERELVFRPVECRKD